MGAETVTEAPPVRDEDQALDLIRGLLSEHLDTSTTIRRIHEVLDGLPAHFDGLRSDIAGILVRLDAVEGRTDVDRETLREIRDALTGAKSEAEAGRRLQKQRLDEEQEARKRQAEGAAIPATKAEAVATEAGARWKERSAIGAAIVLGLAQIVKMLVDLWKGSPS